MQKKISIIITLALVLFFGGKTVSWSQYIPNAPFKPKVLVAPDFSIKDTEGKIFSLSAHRGKPVLIFSAPPGARGAARKYQFIKKFTKLTPRADWS